MEGERERRSRLRLLFLRARAIRPYKSVPRLRIPQSHFSPEHVGESTWLGCEWHLFGWGFTVLSFFTEGVGGKAPNKKTPEPPHGNSENTR